MQWVAITHQIKLLKVLNSLGKNKSKNDFILNIFGKEEQIINKIKKYKINSEFINIINSENVVSNNKP